MRAAALVLPLLLGGCEDEPAANQTGVSVAPANAANKGRVIDLAEALSATERSALANRLVTLERNGRAPVTVVVMEAGADQSLEQIGWAVGGGRSDDDRLLMLVDPVAKRVRIEGALAAEQKALAAGAMQADVAAGRIGPALERGIDQLERMAR